MTEAGSWAVEGIGEDFVPPNADLSLVSKAYRHPRSRELRRRARTAARGGHARRLLLGHAAGGGVALLPRADDAEARGQPGLRFRRQISLQGVQSDFPGAGGLDPSRPPRHRARCRRQPLQRRHRRLRAPAGQSAHGLRPHALGRCLAAAGDRRERTRGRPRRRKRCARGAAHRRRAIRTRCLRGRSRT